MTESQEFIVDLSTGYSTQAKTTNRLWIVLIIPSIIALVGKIDDKNLIELPFTLGKVPAPDFYFVTIVIICVVIIVFSSSLTQTLRTRMLIQKAIENLKEKDLYIDTIHVQDFIDSIVTPTYTRVAPISQFMLGKNQFFGKGEPNKQLKRVATIFYIILKFVTFIFLYFIPVSAVLKCWKNLDLISPNSTFHVSRLVILFLVLLAVITFVILLIGEIKHIYRVSRKLMK